MLLPCDTFAFARQRNESPVDFYSGNSGDECSFKLPEGDSPALALILHLEGKDLEIKRQK